jgi:hypothetical protein
MAGVLQMDPGPFTFREFIRMFRANQRTAWDHTAAFVATQLTGNVRQSSLNPYRKKQGQYNSRSIEREYERLERRNRIRKAAASNV